MALCPNTVASSGKPQELYFALKDEIPAPQVLSQNGNTIALSGGGGAVNVATTSAVALSTQKLTAQTYDTGFNATNFSGLVKSEGEIISAPNLGQGSATLNGGLAEVAIGAVPPASKPKVRFQKAGSPDATIEYDGTKLAMNSSVQMTSEIIDSTASAGLLDQVLTSNGPGTPWQWKSLGGGGGTITSVGAGTNISVTGTGTDPIVNVAISSNLDMSGNNIINGADIDLKGANPSVNFFDSLGSQKATLDYTDINDRVTLAGTNFTFDAANKARLVMDTTFGQGAILRTEGLPIEISRYDATSTTLETEVKLNSTDVTVSLPSGYSVIADSATAKFTSTLPLLQANSGAVEGVEIGYGGANNIVRGFGLPMYISQDAGKEPTDRIILDTIGDGTGGIAVETSEYFDVNSTKEARITSSENVRLNAPIGQVIISAPSADTTVANFAQTTVTNETVVRVETGGILNIDNTGLVSGNDPKLRFTNVDNQSATITKRSVAGGGDLTIENMSNAIILDALQTKVYGGAGQLVVGGNTQAPGTIIVNRSDETLSATMTYTDLDNSFTISNQNNVVIQSINPISGQLAQSVWVADNGGYGAYNMNVVNADNVRRCDFNADTNGFMTISATDAIVCNGILAPDAGIRDQAGSVGTAGQVLTSTGAGLAWNDNPAVWGSFCNNGSVSIAANVITAIPHTVTTYGTNCAIAGGSIVILKDCSKLRIQSSLIASPSINDTTFRFWLFKAPSNVADSQSIVTLAKAVDKSLCVCEWFVSAVVGDVFTVLCEADKASTIYAEAATVSRPACPSIITTFTGYA